MFGEMEQGQGYGHSYMPQPPPLAVPVGGVGAPVSGMAQYPPPAQFPYHTGPYPYASGLSRSSALPPPSIPPQGPGGLSLSSGFFNPWEPPPTPVQAPADNDLQKRIDKLVEYAVKNGPQFEALMKDKQKDNPMYAFLFGAEGHDYYRYKLWLTLNPVGITNPSVVPTVVPSYNPALAALNAAQNALNLSLNPALGGALKPSLSSSAPSAPPSIPFTPAYFEQPHHPQPFYDQFQHENYAGVTYQQAGPPGPLPPEIAAEMKGVMDSLSGTPQSPEFIQASFLNCHMILSNGAISI